MIAIPVYVNNEKNYELLEKCVTSLVPPSGQDYHELKLLINSDDYGSNYDSWQPNTELIQRYTNSVAGAWNDAVELCQSDYSVVLMNQDIECSWFDINRLIANAIEKGICAAQTKEGEPDFALFAVNPEWIKETFGTLRPFDEGFKGAYLEDNDFRYQCKLKGIEIPTLPLEFKHYGSSVMRADEAEQDGTGLYKYFRENHARYINKWGGIRNRETFKTPFNK